VYKNYTIQLNMPRNTPARRNEAQKKRKAAEENIEKKEGSQNKVAKKELVSTDRHGIILTFGQGDVGQLGLGEDIMERKRGAPIKEVEGVKFVQVTCGGMHSVGVSSSGEVYTWGCNDDGALGRVADDGEEFTPGKVKLPPGVVAKQASAGDSHSAILSPEGVVYAWGAYRDASGQIGLTAASLGKKNEVIQVYPNPTDISGTVDLAIKIVSGNDHTVILTEKGNIYTSGTGEQGQLGRIKECFGHRGGRRGLEFILEPQIVRFRKKVKFSDVFAGSFCTYALRKDSDDVYAWGLNNYGQLGSGSTESYFNPEIIHPLSEIRANANSNIKIAGGQHHSILCDGNGVTYCIGRSEYGRLGLGEKAEETPLPKKIEGLSDMKVQSIACGEAVSFAVTEDGHLYSWGLGTTLQLGIGDEEDLLVPTLVKSKNINIEEDEVLQVSSGGQHTTVLVTKRPEKKNPISNES